MFRKVSAERTTTESSIDSLIGENIKIIGKIEGNGSLRIDGTVEGDIVYNGNIAIGETGKVKGDITAEEISLAGTIQGNVQSKSRTTILPTGKLIGNIQVPSFIIHEDAVFEGNCKMTSDKVVELNSKDKAKTEKVQ